MIDCEGGSVVTTQYFTATAYDRAGKVVYHATFSPTHVERGYLDKFPGWSKVDVTTGWLKADVNGATVADTRIATDAERFWDYYQGKVLPRIYDHVMKLTNNRPTTDAQPFHRDLDGLRKAAREVIASARRYKSDARIDGVLVQEMASGTEVIMVKRAQPAAG